MNPRFPGGFGYPELIGGEIINTETDMVDVVDDDKDVVPIWYSGAIDNTYDIKSSLIYTPLNPSAQYKTVCPAAQNLYFLIDKYDYLFCWGNNGFHASGIPNSENIKNITQVDDSKWKDISAGGNFTFAIKQDGTLWSCGANYYGQLGLGDNNDRVLFTQVNNILYKKISAGQNIVIALDVDGYIYTCGLNKYGGCGLGYFSNYVSTLAKVNDKKYIEISAGNSNCYAIDTNGKLFGVGHNTQGELGLFHTNHVNTFTSIDEWNNFIYVQGSPEGSMMCIDSDNYMYGCGHSYGNRLGMGDITSVNYLRQINNIKFKALSAGYINTMAIAMNNDLYAAGTDNYGCFGTGKINTLYKYFTKISSIKASSVACNEFMSFIKKENDI